MGTLFVAQVTGSGHDPGGAAADRGIRQRVLGPALLEVTVQQVRAAGVAHRADLREQRGSGHRPCGPALAQVVAEQVDQAVPVLGRADQLVGIGDAGVALDGVQCEPELSGALAQSDAGVQ